MSIYIDNSIENNLPIQYTEIISLVAEKALISCKTSTDWEIGVLIVDSDEIRQINQRHRNINQVTDVLSFPLYEAGNEFIYSAETPCLGDIVICIERAEEQAKEYGHSLEREIGFLTAHGVLHLLGYDHISPEEESAMCAKQETILSELNLLR